jgi:hypothetical protein
MSTSSRQAESRFLVVALGFAALGVYTLLGE